MGLLGSSLLPMSDGKATGFESIVGGRRREEIRWLAEVPFSGLTKAQQRRTAVV